MRINLLSSFATGVFITTSICAAVYFSSNGGASKASVKTTDTHVSVKSDHLTENEMKNKLIAAGYIVQKKADSNKNIKAGTSPAPNSQKVVKQIVINVSEGMTSNDVGHALQNAHIITNVVTFELDIHNKGIEKYLRPGTYTVNTGMSYDQIVSTIFKKK